LPLFGRFIGFPQYAGAAIGWECSAPWGALQAAACLPRRSTRRISKTITARCHCFVSGGGDVTLASLHSLACVKPAWAAVVFTLWLSITPAEGVRLRPSLCTAIAFNQGAIDPPQHATVAPFIKVV